jgi:uncharacterized protein (TIGR02246 family)
MSRPTHAVDAHTAPPPDESDVRRLIEAWAEAVRRHDLDGVLARHAEELVYFDVPPPEQVRGIDAYAKSWPPFFGYIGDEGQFELTELRIAASQDVAFAHAILLVRGETEATAARVRLTVGLRKIDGAWWVVHEHHSAPYEQVG